MTLTRAEFLKLTAGAGGALMATDLLGPLSQALAAAPLRTRKIPSTGKSIPVIGVGTARIYDVETGDAEFPVLVETLRTFFAAGGRVIDTSPSYGRAEPVLGEIFKRLGQRDKAFIATKISTWGEQEGIDSVRRSMADLGTDRFELLQVHNIKDTAAHLKTIRRLMAEGKVDHVGITISWSSAYEDFEKVMRTEKLDFVQVNYSLGQTESAERILPLAKDRGMAVLINRPFVRGRLFRKVRGKKLPAWTAEFDCNSWAQFMLKFCLSHDAVTCVIPGTDKPGYMTDNLGAALGRLPDAKMRRRMLTFWKEL
jgi:aryl-alcohol dehydrogenase-like predicted oxidoreductase